MRDQKQLSGYLYSNQLLRLPLRLEPPVEHPHSGGCGK